jgi:D-beta-D-heptose 7-phosphate kinase/D-beta-D-heptose 1-phosphate adenosyltransferase
MSKLPTDTKIISYAKLPALRAQASRRRKTIVFASGCYDLTHLGHVVHFAHIKKGDILVVSVANDATVRLLKGVTRPIMPAAIRARMVAALQIVDYVVISKESGIFDHTKILQMLRPDFYVGSINEKFVEQKEKLATLAGAKLIIPSHKGLIHEQDLLSTTALEKKIRLS